MKSPSKLIVFLSLVWCISILWICFGATTTVTTVSPTYATNLIRAFLSGSIGNGKVLTTSGTNLVGVATNSFTIGLLPPFLPVTDTNLYFIGIQSVNGGEGVPQDIVFSPYFLMNKTNGSLQGVFRTYGIFPTNIVFTNGTLPFPQSTGQIGQVLTMGTNQLYWATNAP